MFAQSYYPHPTPAYVPAYPTTLTPSPRARYVSAISRVQEAELEYRAYLAQQEREQKQAQVQAQRERLREQDRIQYLAQRERVRQQRIRQEGEEERVRIQLQMQRQQLELQQQRRRREEEARAVEQLRTLFVHAAVASLLSANPDAEGSRGPVANSKPATQNVEAPSGAQLQRRNRVRVVRPAQQEGARPANVESVRSALKRRLASEPNVEVHATIRRILGDLSPAPKNPVQAQVPATPAIPKSTPASEIAKIERAFRGLTAEFVFPAQLDFSSPSRSLAYTPRNAPLRQYEHELNALLARLDAVDSLGDDGVRAERRRVVRAVEEALEGVGRVVEGRWKLVDTVTRSAAASTVATPSPVPVDASSAVNPTSISTPELIPETTETSSASASSSVHAAADATPEATYEPTTPTVPIPASEEEVRVAVESVPERNSGAEELSSTSASQPVGVEDALAAVSADGDHESPASRPTDIPASPKSLSLSVVVPLPQEDSLGVLDSDDSASNYSDSADSWSEVDA
ncbi:hypothetical protein C8R46DRAFT_403364 [Mycena filopes]|nr:hypothetical protein C8R46DRAFT_403364 [Mycena filopes]